jgi:L-asparaginase II
MKYKTDLSNSIDTKQAGFLVVCVECHYTLSNFIDRYSLYKLGTIPMKQDNRTKKRSVDCL